MNMILSFLLIAFSTCIDNDVYMIETKKEPCVLLPCE